MVRAHRLPRWQACLLYASAGALLLTGLVWLGVHYAIGAGADRLPHPVEPWAMRLHGLAAIFVSFAFGTLAAEHVPRGWRLGEHRRWAGQRVSGTALCACVLTLLFTGYLLYYFVPEGLRPVTGLLHSGIGLLAGGLLLTVHRRGASGPGSDRHDRQ